MVGMDKENDRLEASERLTIGELARRTRLTVKALRWYDEVGVLRPDHVDPASGYRYYRPDQVEPARLVGLLRQLDMPLPAVTAFLAEPSRERLRSWWLAEEAAFEQRRGLVRYLELSLSEGARPMIDIKTREIGARKVATLTGRVRQPELNEFIPASSEKIRSYLRSQGAQDEGLELVLYHAAPTPDVEAPVEVCVPFTGSVEPEGEIVVRIEGPWTEAFVESTKSQVASLEILHAYDALMTWVDEQGYSMPTVPREVYYLDAWDNAGPDEHALDIVVPFTA